MKQCPETPVLDGAVELSGHVWIQELPTGGEFRFQVAASGLVTFATGTRTVDTAVSVPLPFRRAAAMIDECLDREALRAATETPEDVTFCGIATRYEGVEYDWRALPAFVGTDIWSDQKGRFLPPDAATRAFQRLGLPTLPALEKERPAAHADFARFEDEAGFPESAWRDGTAVGVLIRDKSSGRAAAWRSNRNETRGTPEQRSATELAGVYATTERIERTVATLEKSGHSLTVDTIRDRLVADVARETYGDLFPNGEFVASLPAFQSAIAERVQQHQFSRE